MAGPDQTLGSFEFDDADPACPGWDKVPVMAECRDFNSGFLGRLKNGHSSTAFYFSVVYLDL